MLNHEPDDTSPERTDPVDHSVGHQDDAVTDNLQRDQHAEPHPAPQVGSGVTGQEHEESRMPGGGQDDPLHADLEGHGPAVEPGGQHHQPIVADGERDQQTWPAAVCQKDESVLADVQRGDPEASSGDPKSEPLHTASQVSEPTTTIDSRTDQGLNTPARKEAIPSHEVKPEPSDADFLSTPKNSGVFIDKKVDPHFCKASETDQGIADMGATDVLSPDVAAAGGSGLATKIPRYFYYVVQMFRNFLAFFVRGLLSTLMFACDLALSTMIFVFYSVLGIPGAGLLGSAARVALFVCQLALWGLYTMVELVFFLPPALLVPYVIMLFLAYVYLPGAVTSFFEALVWGAHKLLHLVKGLAARPI